MEKETELKKLINVLRRTARMAMQSEWTGGKEDTAPFCVEQYNRVLARLKELDESVGAIFSPLPEGSSLTVTAMACRQLVAYYEDEVGRHGWGWGGHKAYAFGFDAEAFKDFWRKSAHEFEDLGEYIRESIEEWFRVKKKEDKKEGSKKKEDASEKKEETA
jgi:hypothetical protein